MDGVTFNEEEAAYAKPFYRTLSVADLDTCKLDEMFPVGGYDAIVCADVLEHLRFPDRILDAARRLLKPDGQVLISIPNAAYCGLIGELMLGEFRYRNEGLLDSTVATCSDKPIAQTTYARKKDSHVFQADIGEAAGQILAARMLMDQTTRMIDDAACARAPLSTGQRSDIRVSGAIAIDLLQKAVDRLMNLAGSSAFNLANPIQRYWRDFSVGSRHAALAPGVGFEVHGRQLLGVDPNIVPEAMI